MVNQNKLHVLFASESLLFLLAALIILLFRKKNSFQFTLTVILSIAVPLMSALIYNRFRISVLGYMGTVQMLPLIFLSIFLGYIGSRLERTGRLFS